MRMAKAFWLLPLFVFISFSAQAKIIHVPADFSTIQAGINGAVDGDTVLVARGHYYERINFHRKPILVASNFIFDSLQVTIDSTIIDGDTLVLGVSDTGSLVVFVSGEDSNSTITGFTLQKGIGTIGPGVYWGDRCGGGIYCDSSSPTICNNIIKVNSAVLGGGICCDSGSSPTINNNTISRNYAWHGGGVYCAPLSSVTIYNNAINGNVIFFPSAMSGGGIYCSYYSSFIIKNNIISNSIHGEGIVCDTETFIAVISYNDFWNNALRNFHFETPWPGFGDTTWGTNFNGTPCDPFYNIIRDPLFEDTSTFKLACNSPCIDAGDSSFEVPPNGGKRIDIGAVEFISQYTHGDVDNNGWITMVDIVYLANYFLKSGPSPIPVWCSGDVNCDRIIALNDVIYLANFLLKGGPPPCK